VRTIHLQCRMYLHAISYNNICIMLRRVGTYIIYPYTVIHNIIYSGNRNWNGETQTSVNTIFSIRSAVLRSLERIKYNFRNDFSLGFLRLQKCGYTNITNTTCTPCSVYTRIIYIFCVLYIYYNTHTFN